MRCWTRTLGQAAQVLAASQTVIVGQALRDGLETRTQVNQYLEKLHKGEATFDDEVSEGRSKSLGASLSYGFEQAFSADERKVLALLHFFQGFVNTQAFDYMSNPEFVEWVNQKNNNFDFYILFTIYLDGIIRCFIYLNF